APGRHAARGSRPVGSDARIRSRARLGSHREARTHGSGTGPPPSPAVRCAAADAATGGRTGSRTDVGAADRADDLPAAGHDDPAAAAARHDAGRAGRRHPAPHPPAVTALPAQRRVPGGRAPRAAPAQPGRGRRLLVSRPRTSTGSLWAQGPLAALPPCDTPVGAADGASRGTTWIPALIEQDPQDTAYRVMPRRRPPVAGSAARRARRRRCSAGSARSYPGA
ncbi:MAG: hypothetical protein QOG20_3783, partial [Pseudonocardiales bacterium]|nr:hypothetical protein [Pseudonocardiales bacterium]